jgi:hypothetical protein
MSRTVPTSASTICMDGSASAVGGIIRRIVEDIHVIIHSSEQNITGRGPCNVL